MIKESKFKPYQKVDMLTLLRIVGVKNYEKSRFSTYIWECKCDCGNICTINEHTLLKSNHFHSCGCYQKTQNTCLSSERRVPRRGIRMVSM